MNSNRCLLGESAAGKPAGGLEDYVSPARLSLWLKCPLAFRLKYVDGVQTPASPGLALGKLVHRGLELFYRHRQQGITLAAAEVTGWLGDCWGQLAAEEAITLASLAEEKALCRQAGELVRAYLEEIDPQEPIPLAVEEVIQAPLVDPRSGDPLGLPLLGIVDLVLAGDEGPVVVDFKTAARAQAPLEISHEIQLSAYAYLVRCLFGQRESALEIRSLVKTRLPQIHAHRYPPRATRHFGRLCAAVRAYLDDLGQKRFVFRPHLGCSLCEYRDSHCPGWQG
jgi:CRISPR/Cas system-associated exonuclease Cas4 (RecB family)